MWKLPHHYIYIYIYVCICVLWRHFMCCFQDNRGGGGKHRKPTWDFTDHLCRESRQLIRKLPGTVLICLCAGEKRASSLGSNLFKPPVCSRLSLCCCEFIPLRRKDKNAPCGRLICWCWCADMRDVALNVNSVVSLLPPTGMSCVC